MTESGKKRVRFADFVDPKEEIVKKQQATLGRESIPSKSILDQGEPIGPCKKSCSCKTRNSGPYSMFLGICLFKHHRTTKIILTTKSFNYQLSSSDSSDRPSISSSSEN